MKKEFRGEFVEVDDPALLLGVEEEEEPESWGDECLATIFGTSVETVRRKGRRPHYRVTVSLAVCEGLLDGYNRPLHICADKVFELVSAAAVAEARRFFAWFDFPLVSARDLSAACERARQGVCRVRVADLEEEGERVEILGLVGWHGGDADTDGGRDVWDHERHWRGPRPTPGHGTLPTD